MLFSSTTTSRARRGMMREWRLFSLSIFSLAVAFVCLGSALLVVVNLKAIEQLWSRAGRASIYLKDNAPQSDVDAVTAALEKTPGVTKVRYVSAGQARSELAQEQTN